MKVFIKNYLHLNYNHNLNIQSIITNKKASTISSYYKNSLKIKYYYTFFTTTTTTTTKKKNNNKMNSNTNNTANNTIDKLDKLLKLNTNTTKNPITTSQNSIDPNTETNKASFYLDKAEQLYKDNLLNEMPDFDKLIEEELDLNFDNFTSKSTVKRIDNTIYTMPEEYKLQFLGEKQEEDLLTNIFPRSRSKVAGGVKIENTNTTINNNSINNNIDPIIDSLNEHIQNEEVEAFESLMKENKAISKRIIEENKIKKAKKDAATSNLSKNIENNNNGFDFESYINNLNKKDKKTTSNSKKTKPNTKANANAKTKDNTSNNENITIDNTELKSNKSNNTNKTYSRINSAKNILSKKTVIMEHTDADNIIDKNTTNKSNKNKTNTVKNNKPIISTSIKGKNQRQLIITSNSSATASACSTDDELIVKKASKITTKNTSAKTTGSPISNIQQEVKYYETKTLNNTYEYPFVNLGFNTISELFKVLKQSNMAKLYEKKPEKILKVKASQKTKERLENSITNMPISIYLKKKNPDYNTILSQNSKIAYFYDKIQYKLFKTNIFALHSNRIELMISKIQGILSSNTSNSRINLISNTKRSIKNKQSLGSIILFVDNYHVTSFVYSIGESKSIPELEWFNSLFCFIIIEIIKHKINNKELFFHMINTKTFNLSTKLQENSNNDVIFICNGLINSQLNRFNKHVLVTESEGNIVNKKRVNSINNADDDANKSKNKSKKRNMKFTLPYISMYSNIKILNKDFNGLFKQGSQLNDGYMYMKL